jgi:hypothetical protein
MMTTANDHLARYLSLFKGREDYFAQQHESFYTPVPRPLDAFYLYFSRMTFARSMN